MNSLITKINEADGLASLQPASCAEIEESEEKLGLHFSADYREYLLNFGVASFDGRELTGICKSERLNVTSATERARLRYPCFPPNAYVIEDLQLDHVLAIQDANGTVYLFIPDGSCVPTAESLKAYLFPEN